MVRVLFVKRKHFGRINIGDFDKIISYTVYVLKFAARSYFNVRVLPKWHSRYGSQITFVKYLPVSVLSLAEYLYWWPCFLPILLLVTSSPSFSYIYIYIFFSLVEAGSLIMKPALMVRQLLVCQFSLNNAAIPFNNHNLMQKMTPAFNYIIIIGGLNVGDFIQ